MFAFKLLSQIFTENLLIFVYLTSVKFLDICLQLNTHKQTRIVSLNSVLLPLLVAEYDDEDDEEDINVGDMILSKLFANSIRV